MTSQWIWVDHAERHNTWARFRKRFNAAAGPVRVRVAVDSKYWLWLNGQPIVREGGLKRGPTVRDTYVDTVELPLAEGENTLAILAWHWGGVTAGHNDSGRGGLFVDGPGIASDATWRASIHPAFGPSERPLFNNVTVLPEYPVNFDARRDEPDWMQPAFDDSGWAAAIEAGAPPCEPWGQLVDRPIPLWRDSKIKPYEWVHNYVGKLPANLQVYPCFRIDAPAGETIHINIERDKKTTTYTTRAGVQEFEVPAWGNGHYVTYTIPPAVKVLQLGYCESGYGCDFAGQFECDDEALNTLWRKAARTTYVCMRDTYMDCPDRERQPWPNDAVPMMEQACYAYDRRADALFGKMIREFVDWRTADGILWGPVPNGRFRGSYREIVGVTLSMICGWWHYYLYSGDEATIRYAYPHARVYLLKHFHVDPVELVQHRGPDKVEWGTGTQNWYDWGDHQDWRLLDNTWLALALDNLQRIAEALGDKQGHAALAARWQTIKDGFDRVFWRGDHYASPGYSGEPDERGHALAVHASLVPWARREQVAKVLIEQNHASITAEKFVTASLLFYGYVDEAIARLKRRFAKEITSPYSTLPETWGEESNHGWSGWPLTLLARDIVGLAPTAPGWAKLAVTPRLGHLRRATCSIETPRGRGAVELIREETGGTMKLATPVLAWVQWGTWALEVAGRRSAPGEGLELPAGEWEVRAV
jgi:hypothetical protein